MKITLLGTLALISFLIFQVLLFSSHYQRLLKALHSKTATVVFITVIALMTTLPVAWALNKVGMLRF